MSALAVALAAAAVVAMVGAWARPRPTRRPSTPRRPARQTDHGATAIADYLAAVARELRGGGTVTAAFLAVTPTHPGGAVMLSAHRRVLDGVPIVDALAAPPPGDRTQRRRRDTDRADRDVAVHALSCAADVGGPAAVAIDAAASVLRERAAVAADATAHSAQARLSARVLTVVPLGFATWTVVSDERARHTYLATSAGAFCVAAGLTLNLAGWWWMRRIVDPRGWR